MNGVQTPDLWAAPAMTDTLPTPRNTLRTCYVRVLGVLQRAATRPTPISRPWPIRAAATCRSPSCGFAARGAARPHRLRGDLAGRSDGCVPVDVTTWHFVPFRALSTRDDETQRPERFPHPGVGELRRRPGRFRPLRNRERGRAGSAPSSAGQSDQATCFTRSAARDFQ
jgi:hypothetical protein